MEATLIVLATIGGTLAWIAWQLRNGQKKKSAQRSEFDRWVKLAGPDGVFVPYEGGHPELPNREQAAIRTTADGLSLVVYSGTVAEIPFSSIVGIACESNVQHVNTGGGRDLKGALVGGLLFGPVGAIVGGHGKANLRSFEESRTVITILYRRIQTQIVLRTNRDVHSRIVGMLAKAPAVGGAK